MFGGSRPVDALMLKEIRHMPHGLALVGDVERQESDALQCLQHFGDVAAFFGVGHQFAPDQAGVRSKIAFVVGIIEQSNGQQSGFRR